MENEKTIKVLKWALNQMEGRNYIVDGYGNTDPFAKVAAFGTAIRAIERDIPKERTYMNTCPTCGKVVVNIFGNLLCSNPNCRQAIKQE